MTRPFVIHPEDCETESWDDPVRGQVRWWTLVSGDRRPSDSLVVGVAELPGKTQYCQAKLSRAFHLEASLTLFHLHHRFWPTYLHV